MENPAVEEKITDLEGILGHFINVTTKSLNRLSREMSEFKDEMSEFKDEMREFKDEMKEYKRNSEERIKSNEKKSDAFAKEMKEFKDEMKEYKRNSEERIKSNEEKSDAFSKEMKEFKIEAIKDRRNLTKQMGEISNKMGTLVEDIIAPAVRPVILKYFHEEVLDFSVNRKKYIKVQNLRAEFDVIAVTEKCVYLVEVKSAPRVEHFELFTANIEKFRQLFPEFKNLKLIPIFASIRFDSELIPKISQAGFYAMAYRDWDYMDILNFEDVERN